MTFTNDLLAGLGALIDAEAGATWRPNGIYPAADPWPIFLTTVPASPDQMLALFPYTVSEDTRVNDVVQGVQIRSRCGRDPRPGNTVNDAIFDALHGREHTAIGGVPVVLTYRNSHAYLGVDSGGRHEWTSNYYLHAARPSPHRLD